MSPDYPGEKTVLIACLAVVLSLLVLMVIFCCICLRRKRPNKLPESSMTGITSHNQLHHQEPNYPPASSTPSITILSSNGASGGAPSVPSTGITNNNNISQSQLQRQLMRNQCEETASQEKPPTSLSTHLLHAPSTSQQPAAGGDDEAGVAEESNNNGPLGPVMVESLQCPTGAIPPINVPQLDPPREEEDHHHRSSQSGHRHRRHHHHHSHNQQHHQYRHRHRGAEGAGGRLSTEEQFLASHHHQQQHQQPVSERSAPDVLRQFWDTCEDLSNHRNLSVAPPPNKTVYDKNSPPSYRRHASNPEPVMGVPRNHPPHPPRPVPENAIPTGGVGLGGSNGHPGATRRSNNNNNNSSNVSVNFQRRIPRERLGTSPPTLPSPPSYSESQQQHPITVRRPPPQPQVVLPPRTSIPPPTYSEFDPAVP